MKPSTHRKKLVLATVLLVALGAVFLFFSLDTSATDIHIPVSVFSTSRSSPRDTSLDEDGKRDGSSSATSSSRNKAATDDEDSPHYRRHVSDYNERVILEDDAALPKNNGPQTRLNEKARLTAEDLVLVSPAEGKLGVATCEEATNCLTCLFRTAPQPTLSSTPALSTCVWLAARQRCVSSALTRGKTGAAAKYAGADQEVDSCPAILHRQLPVNINVVYVGIRKGGPEALLQLHFAASYWGFNTHLESRKDSRSKGGGMVPFFADVYKAEIERARVLMQARDAASSGATGGGGHFRYWKSFDNWLHNGRAGDVLIATETWSCRNERTDGPGHAQGSNDNKDDAIDSRASILLSEPVDLRRKGVRYAQWHLTVWPRKARSACTIMAHTRYIASYYMRSPLLSVLFPYVSPHIVKHALSFSAEQLEQRKVSSYSGALLMYDGDVKSLHPGTYNSAKGMDSLLVRKVAGYTPQALYDEYSKASICVDWELPGGERFIYESVLYRCCPIIDRSLNGLDTEDFPMPDELRVSPSTRRHHLVSTPDYDNFMHNYPDDPAASPADVAAVAGTSPRLARLMRRQENFNRIYSPTHNRAFIPTLHMAIGECYNTNHRARTMRRVEPFRNSVLRQRVRFHKHVRRYFSNSVHVVTAIATAREMERYAVHFIVSTLAAVPFATIEIFVTPEAANSVSVIQHQISLLFDNSYLAAVLWTVWKPREAARSVHVIRAAGGGAEAAGREGDVVQSGLSMLGHVLANGAQVVTTAPSRAGYVAFVPCTTAIVHRSFVHYLGSLAALSRVAATTGEAPHAAAGGLHAIYGPHFVFADLRDGLGLERMSPDKHGHRCPELENALADSKRLGSATTGIIAAWHRALACDSHAEHRHAEQQAEQQERRRKFSGRDFTSTFRFVADAERMLVVNPERRLHSRDPTGLLFVAPVADIASAAQDFLCEHVLYVKLFPANCR